jgi:hypothetical protein
MVFYDFLRWNLAWMATVALLWPLTIGLAALAYRVRQGNTPDHMDPNEFWLRCTLGSLGLEVITIAFLGLDYWLTEADLPAGPIHAIVFFGYVGAGWWLFWLLFDLDDPAQGLSLFVLYMYLPIAVLYVVNKLLGWLFPNGNYLGFWLNYVGSWLKEP